MPTEAKRATVAELVEAFSGSKGAIVSEYRGLTVSDLSKVRRELREKGVSYTVVKNRLAKIAAEQAGRSDIVPLLSGPTAITLGGAFALPLNTDWGLNLRLGVAQVKTKGEAPGISLSESKAKVYAGVGVTYAISPTVKLELGVDSTNAEIDGDKGSVRLISLGATFAF